MAPLILTLALDASSTARFEALRRNTSRLSATSSRPTSRCSTTCPVTGSPTSWPRPLPPAASVSVPDRGDGPALSRPRGRLHGRERAELTTLRASLARAWAPWLTPQDRQPFRPHVTVQNKAAPAEARALVERLSAGFAPFPVRAEALLLFGATSAGRGRGWAELSLRCLTDVIGP